jgi:hypothetical protein
LSNPSPPDHPKFEVAVEPAPRTEVVEVEEDEDSKREREAALASTFDPALAHHGKTDEELIEERKDDARMLGDAAIAAAIVIAVAENESLDVEDVVPPDRVDDGGE